MIGNIGGLIGGLLGVTRQAVFQSKDIRAMADTCVRRMVDLRRPGAQSRGIPDDVLQNAALQVLIVRSTGKIKVDLWKSHRTHDNDTTAKELARVLGVEVPTGIRLTLTNVWGVYLRQWVAKLKSDRSSFGKRKLTETQKAVLAAGRVMWASQNKVVDWLDEILAGISKEPAIRKPILIDTSFLDGLS